MEFTIRLQSGALNSDDSQRLNLLLNAAREAIHSAKAIKNIRHNLLDFNNPATSLPDDYARLFRDNCADFVSALYSLRARKREPVEFETLAELLQRTSRQHDEMHEHIYSSVRDDRINEREVSTLLNVNRELYISHRSLLLAMGNYFLTPERADDLERLPTS